MVATANAERHVLPQGLTRASTSRKRLASELSSGTSTEEVFVLILGEPAFEASLLASGSESPDAACLSRDCTSEPNSWAGLLLRMVRASSRRALEAAEVAFSFAVRQPCRSKLLTAVSSWGIAASSARPVTSHESHYVRDICIRCASSWGPPFEGRMCWLQPIRAPPPGHMTNTQGVQHATA